MALCTCWNAFRLIDIRARVIYENAPLYDRQLGGILMKVAQESLCLRYRENLLSWSRHEKANAEEITQLDLLEEEISMHGYIK